jgi:hypothetical protein
MQHQILLNEDWELPEQKPIGKQYKLLLNVYKHVETRDTMEQVQRILIRIFVETSIEPVKEVE